MIQNGSHTALTANTVNVWTVDWQQQDLKEFVGVVMETVFFFLEHEHCNCVNLLPKVQHTVTCYTNLEYVKVHACHDEVCMMDYSFFFYPITDSIFVFSKFLPIILIILPNILFIMPIIPGLNTIHRAPNRFLLYR